MNVRNESSLTLVTKYVQIDKENLTVTSTLAGTGNKNLTVPGGDAIERSLILSLRTPSGHMSKHFWRCLMSDLTGRLAESYN